MKRKRIIFITSLIILLPILLVYLNQTYWKEKRLTAATIEELERVYHLPKDMLEVISIEEADDPYKNKLLGIDKIFNGKDYIVQVKVNEEFAFKIEGTINSRKRYFRGDNYIQKKHEVLLANQSSYQTLFDNVEKLGVKLDGVKEGTHYKRFRKGIRTLHFTFHVNDDQVDSGQLLTNFRSMAKEILAQVKTDVGLDIHIPIKEYDGDEVIETVIHVEMYDERENYIEQEFKRLLHEVRALHLMNEQLLREVDPFGMTAFTSRLESKYRGQTHDLHYHRLGLLMEKEAAVENVGAVMTLLEEKGLGDSYVYLQLSDGWTKACKVKDIEEVDDFEACSSIDEQL